MDLDLDGVGRRHVVRTRNIDGQQYVNLSDVIDSLNNVADCLDSDTYDGLLMGRALREFGMLINTKWRI